MASDAKAKSKKGRDAYSHYREMLGMPHVSKKQIDEARANLQAIARAVCEHVWGKKFY